ncbi:peptidoglycan editing factor PgeF [Evansella tamaricis]|uniref:Purine nucleoside phosphorylase n=1 Tax=Evansella tamaricis TaxID=2069301 RepID=A0ABS6JMD1_9BACI|nr:peptidoglycan editing factor PgeF [Evansella tamaricis]MBU9714842.1 peptidoglycan editing factor PgeF [Evansella tamaricis]
MGDKIVFKEPFSLLNEQILKLDHWDSLLPDLTVGFTTKNGGISEKPFTSLNVGLHVNDESSQVLENRQRIGDLLSFTPANWVCGEQIHENRIEEITAEDAGRGVFDYESSITGTDGLYTKEPNILLASFYADCVPLFFLEPKKKLLGVAHAGWKGTVKDIAGEMVRLWQEKEGIHPRDIHAAIGPSIGPCCYVVDDYVIQFVNEVLGKSGENLVYNEVDTGQYSLDLKALNRFLMEAAGIQQENIVQSKYCTSCETSLFFSHRRDKGKTGRLMSFIGRKEK